MFTLLLPLAFAADFIDVVAISAAVDTCLAAVRSDFDSGEVLPSRAISAATNAELCSKESSLAMHDLDLEFARTLDAYKSAKARLEAVKPDVPALAGQVTSKDPWVSAAFDRARAGVIAEPESPDVTIVASAWDTMQRLETDRETLVDAVDRVSEDVKRFLAVRDGLYLMDCTGEIDLVYPESMATDARYTHEEQCAQLTKRRNGITTAATYGNPAAAKR
jgi:hypothetical protein